MDLGINLCFAIKRWPEPERWATIVADDLGLASVQFTMDLIDPWWPAAVRSAAAKRARAAAASRGIAIHSVQIGLAGYTYNGLLHPDADVRALGRDWWRRSIDLAAELGAGAAGGPLGALSAADAASPARRTALRAALVEDVHALAAHADAAGLDCLLVEPTPLPREIPSTVAETQALLADCAGTAVPLRLVLDVGHMLYRPLYGDDVALDDWLRPLAAPRRRAAPPEPRLRDRRPLGLAGAARPLRAARPSRRRRRRRARSDARLPRGLRAVRAGRRVRARARRELRRGVPLSSAYW